MKDERGFTLFELVLVLAIISLLLGIVLPVATDKIEEAKRVQARIQVERIYGALMDFYDDLGFWPKYIDGQKAPGGGETYNILRSTRGDVPTSSDSKWLATEKVDYLEDHLITNEPVYKERIGAPPSHGWDGPYLQDFLRPDPWGNKYYVNVEFLDEKGKPSEMHKVWILSAGPNEVIDTTYKQFQTTGTLQGDDIGLAIIHT